MFGISRGTFSAVSDERDCARRHEYHRPPPSRSAPLPAIAKRARRLQARRPPRTIDNEGQSRHELKHGSGRKALAKHWCRSEEHTSELQQLMRITYAVFCLKKTIR